MDIFDKEVSFYAKINAKPERVKLIDFLTTNKYRSTVEAIRQERDKDRRTELKRGLPAITPSGIFKGGHRADNLVEHTGVICIDIDAKDNEDVRDFDNLKERIADVPYVAYCGLSVSGEGYFVLIPITSPKYHKAHFEAIKRDFHRCGLNIDAACGDVSRLRFASYDPSPYVNRAASPYDRILARKITKGRATPTPTENVRLMALIEAVEESGTDITETYHDWFKVACALANAFGESGRGLFHRISKFHPCYDAEETDGEFDKALRGKYEQGGITINTIFQLAKEKGILINDLVADYGD